MKKAVIISCAILIACAASIIGIYAWFGARAEKQYNDLLAEANKQLPVNEQAYGDTLSVSIDIAEYERGIFRTTSEEMTTVLINMPTADGNLTKEFRLQSTNTFLHGPVAFMPGPDGSKELKFIAAFVKSKMFMEPEKQGGLSSFFADYINSADSSAIFGLDDTVKTHLIFPAVNKKFESESRPTNVDLAEFVMDADYSLEAKSGKLIMKLPGIKIFDEAFALTLSEVSFQMDYRGSVFDLQLGDTTFSIKKITATEGESEEIEPVSLFSLHSLVFNSKTGVEVDETVSMNFLFSFDQISFSNENYGPISIDLALKGYDAKLLAEFVNIIKTGGMAGQDILGQQDLLMRWLMLQLKKSFEVKLSKFYFVLKDGEILLSGNLNFDGDKLQSVNNPAMLAEAVNLNLDLRVSEGLLALLFEEYFNKTLAGQGSLEVSGHQLAGRQLQAFEEEKILVKENSEYRLIFSFQGDEMHLNGEPQTFESLVALVESTMSESIPRPPGQESQPTNPDQAIQIAALKEELAANPDKVSAWIELGNIWYDTNQPAEAIKAYTKALELQPENPDVLTDLGTMYRRTGQTQKALGFFDKAIAFDSVHEVSRLNKGIVLFYDIGDQEEALKVWEELVRINPTAIGPGGTPIVEIINELKATPD